MNNLNAERAVIGCVLLDNATLNDIFLDADDFHSEAHHNLWKAIQVMKAIDRITLDAATKGLYTAEIMECEVPTAANLQYYCGIVKDLSNKRKLLKISDRIAASVHDSEADDILLTAIKDLKSIETKPEIEYYHMRELTNSVLNDMVLRKIESRGLVTHIKGLDKSLGFLRNGDLVVLAARPSMGKTALALSIMLNMGINGDPAILFSQEMSKEQLVERLLCMKSGANMQDVNLGINLEINTKKLVQAGQVIHSLPLWLNDIGGISYSKMEKIIIKAHKDNGIKCAFIDYLQLLKLTKSMGDNRNQQIGHITRNLKALAKNLNIPIVLLSQLNRSLEQRTNKRPMLSDLRESGEIEQDADVVMFIYRDEVYNEKSEQKGTAEIIIAKYRNGATGWLKLAFLSESMRFADLEEGVI